MMRNILLLFCIFSSSILLAQDKMFIHKSNGLTIGVLKSLTDSVYFTNSGAELNLKVGSVTEKFLVSELDSISFGDTPDTIVVTYNGTAASVENPLAFQGVAVTINGADVVVTSTSTTRDINYKLLGYASDGSFKIYSEKRFNLILAGVEIINADGPAINVQAKNKVTVELKAGTSNYLTDGSTYATSTEDQKGAFFSEGQLVFTGYGKLSVTSKAKHGICSDDYIDIKGGAITIVGAKSDGVHANNYFTISDGSLNITATGDGIDCEDGYVYISGGSVTSTNASADVKGIAADSILAISGGTVNLTIGGDQSKGLKSKQNIDLSGGTITINASGSVVKTASGSGYDVSYCSAIKSDSTVYLSGANVKITCTGVAGKGISADKNIIMTSGSANISTTGSGATYKNTSGVTDSYSSACLSADAGISLLAGSLTASSSGSGAKGLTCDGTIVFGAANSSPTVNLTTSGAKFTVSGSDYCHPKTVVSTDEIVINNGTITISSTDDGMHSEKSITQNNGNVTITKSTEGVESKYVTINGGEMSVTASDDGFNTTFSTVVGGTESNDGSLLTINGGYVYATATGGDAIDSNGNIVIAGGTVVANGPTSQPNEAIDFNGTLNVNGGFLIAGGPYSNMVKAMSSSSSQYGLFITSQSSTVAAGSIFHIQDASGNDVVTFKPLRTSGAFWFSSSALKTGVNYTLYYGGSSTGTAKDGLYTGGTYTAGTLKKTFSISSKVTNISL